MQYIPRQYPAAFFWSITFPIFEVLKSMSTLLGVQNLTDHAIWMLITCGNLLSILTKSVLISTAGANKPLLIVISYSRKVALALLQTW